MGGSMAHREMVRRIRELERRMGELETRVSSVQEFRGPYIAFDGEDWVWSNIPPWHPTPKPGENGERAA